MCKIRRSFINKETTRQLIHFLENNSVIEDYANLVVLSYVGCIVYTDKKFKCINSKSL
jgi:hypothetical protein